MLDVLAERMQEVPDMPTPLEELRALLFGAQPYDRPSAPEAELLGDLAPALPPQHLRQALGICRDAAFVPPQTRAAVVMRACAIDPGGEMERMAAEVVARRPESARWLLGAAHARLAGGAITAAASMPGIDVQAATMRALHDRSAYAAGPPGALADLARDLSQEQMAGLLQELAAAAASDPATAAPLLQALAPAVPAGLAAQAARIAMSLPAGWSSNRALAALRPMLPDAIGASDARRARSVSAAHLRDLLGRLSPSSRDALLTELLDAIWERWAGAAPPVARMAAPEPAPPDESSRAPAAPLELTPPPAREVRAPPSMAMPAAQRDPARSAADAAPDAEPVDAAVFCPPEAGAGTAFLLQVFLYPPGAEDDARRRAEEADAAARRRGVLSLPLDLPRGTRVDLRLELPGLKVDEPDADLVWRGQVTAAQFEVAVPAAAAPGSAIGRIRFAIAGVPAGVLRFQVGIVASATAAAEAGPAELSVQRYHRAFVSYSSEDRGEVLRRVQAFRIAGLKVFQDVLDLDPGERWERALYREIDNCDVFLLFWSSHAAASEWVGKEIDYALARNHGREDLPPAIQPVPIEGPPIPPPPSALGGMHFNDALLAHIAAAGGVRAPR